jgi:hypothetical protein
MLPLSGSRRAQSTTGIGDRPRPYLKSWTNGSGNPKGGRASHTDGMYRIHYAGDSIVTGTEIARALLDYAQALAQVGTSSTVDVPTVNEDGSSGRSEILIGPASQLIADAETSDFDEVVDDALVAYMREEAARLRNFGSPAPRAEATPSQTSPGFEDYEL